MRVLYPHPVGNTEIVPIGMFPYNQVETASPGTEFCLTRVPSLQDLKAAFHWRGEHPFPLQVNVIIGVCHLPASHVQ